MRRPVFILIVLMGVAFLPMPAAFDGGQVAERQERHLPSPYQLAQVERGQVITTVLAAGTVQPVVSVVVGSEVSGQVKEILVDYNDTVQAGQPIARLDPQLFKTRVDQARAEVDVAGDALRIAKGEVLIAEAALDTAMAERAKAEALAKRNEVTIEHTRRQFERKSTLTKGGWASASDVDDARAAYELALAESTAATAEVTSQEARVGEAKAQLVVARARVHRAEAEVRRSQAALHQAQADLERTVIRAPMDGVVIGRSVEAGQTVAASFEAPTLFTIGVLSSVNVEIAVDEADIGSLRDGQSVTFSVDAYPAKTFDGRIGQIRKSPHIEESVVTYRVIALAENEDLLLLPGMTATVKIVTGKTPNVLQVPTAALRYQPEMVHHSLEPHVWTYETGSIRPVPVVVGMSTDDVAEIVDGPLSEGDYVVIGDAHTGLAARGLGAKVADWMVPLQASLGFTNR